MARTVAAGKMPLESLVVFRNSRGLDGRGTLLHLNRHSVAFEVYNPYSIVQLSEVLLEFRIIREERAIYQGRVVVSTLVPTGALTIVSATLVDPWSDLSGLLAPEALRAETLRFIQHWEGGYRLEPKYQLAVSAIANFLQELSRWLGQAEAMYGAGRMATVNGHELAEHIGEPLHDKLNGLFAAFEQEARQIGPEQMPVHKAFAQRELHPLLLCDPFIHRTFTKPLGYAGDYLMVRMIVGQEQPNLAAYPRVINTFNLNVAPAVAHRNRIEILHARLEQEATRCIQAGKRLRVLNIGCGPAAEVERFLTHSALASSCDFVLVDFNQETLAYVEERLTRITREKSRSVSVRTVHQSIHDLLKAAANAHFPLPDEYDLVYCAGLFDYLPNRVCQRLIRLLYEWTAKGGLTMVTNVHARNPVRCYMEHVAEWHLEYRDERQFATLAPENTFPHVFVDESAVDIFLELRRPEA